jgi:hypothetical protein
MKRLKVWLAAVAAVGLLGSGALLAQQSNVTNAVVIAALQAMGLFGDGYLAGDVPVWSATATQYQPSSATPPVFTTITIAPSTCAAPGIKTVGALTTGLATAVTPSVSIAVGGACGATWTATTFQSLLKEQVPVGTSAAPSIFGAGATTTGLSITATPSVIVGVGGADILTATATALTAAQPLTIPVGGTATPSLNFAGFLTDGISRDSSNGGINISQGATAYVYLGNTGSGGLAAVYAQGRGVGWASAAASGWDTAQFREANAHLMQRNGTNAQRASWANTYTSATNYSGVSIDMQTRSNFALFGTRTAATGTTFPLVVGAEFSNGDTVLSAARFTASTAGNAIILGLDTTTGSGVTTAVTGNQVVVWPHVENSTSGTRAMLAITPTYNQSSGNAANTDLLINRTETAIGSGAQLLLDAQRGGVTEFNVSRAGVVTAIGGYTIGGGANYSMAAAFAIRTAPTIASGGCTSPAVTWDNGTALFLLTIGSSCAGVKSLTLTMPAASHFWGCDANNNTSDAQQASNYVIFRATSTTAVVMTSYDRVTGITEDFTAADTYLVKCLGG